MSERENNLESVENKNSSHVKLAEEIIQSLEDIDGVSFPNKRKAIDYLTSSDVLVKRGGFVDLFECDDEVENIGEKLVEVRSSQEFVDRWSKILKNQLLSKEYQEQVVGSSVDILKERKIEMNEWNTEINTVDLNTLDGSADDIKDLAKSVIDDQNSNADQGVFWNVLISKDGQYVLKTERDFSQHDKLSRDLLTYPILIKVFGKECLLKQAVLKDSDSGKLSVIQEKLDLDKMLPLSDTNVEKFLEGKVGGEVKEALENQVNYEKLKQFIDNAKLLTEKYGLSLDVLGDNVYFGVDKNGLLEIKIVDYGCFEKGKDDDYINHVELFLKRLEMVL